jgi:acyl-coenzyme A thioesterase PaaI-like protein
MSEDTNLHDNARHTPISMDGNPTIDERADRMHEGPPGHIHGGIVAALLDEAMSKLNRPLNVLAMTRHMEIDYLRPVPLYQPLVLIGRHLNRPAKDGTPGRKLFHQAEIQHPNGTVLARSKGLFIAIDEKLLFAAGITPPEI